MLENNVKAIMNILNKKDLVLDIGGWAMPFNRTNYVVDICSYETRGLFGSQGGKKEFFNKKTWIIHDVSSKKKLPFKDKQFDFVICSHTLEDIRDPIFLCSEMIRVGKQGYIEVPSQKLELTKGVANNSYCGYYHHRWIIDIKNNNIKFRLKPHFIHNIWKYHFPKKFLKLLSKEDRVSYLYWNNSFDYAEIIQISRDKVQDYIEEIIKKERVYPEIKYYFYELYEDFIDLLLRARKKIFPKAYYHKYMDTLEFISK